jgi:UDP-N-acetyl-D-glucosamine dehydrogenase
LPDDRVAVIGLGYVGLPLGLSLTEAGVEVLGVDSSSERVQAIRRGESPVDDVTPERLERALQGQLTVCTTDEARLDEADVVFVCVPTPLTDAREPDLSAVLAAADLIASSLRRHQLVILQSTTYPGTTTGPFRLRLESSGLTAGQEFGLAFAPERISPGDPTTWSDGVPKLVGGLTRRDTERAAALLRRTGALVHELSSPDAAELAKLLENVFRNVNIALVNQLALLCERMGLDVWEIIDAAATKPFGFMPFRPGPGVGGHCIPVDPYYLAWRAREFGVTDRFVELAGDINAAMPHHVANLVATALNEHSLPVRGSRVGIVGVAFKPNVSDHRNSPSRAVMAELGRRGAQLAYHDPHVPSFPDAEGTLIHSVDLADLIAGSDVLVSLVDHRDVDWGQLYGSARLVVDAVNTSRHAAGGARVLRLGAGWR